MPRMGTGRLKKVLLTATLAFAACSAGAVQTRGATTCDQWLADNKNNGWEIVSDHFWLLGYLSGLAVGLNNDFLVGSSNDGLYSWMDNYCETNWSKGIGEAAQVLARERIKEQQDSKKN
jgi:hypothetical protein